MAYTLAQHGASLSLVNTSGTKTALTLPTGVLVDATLRPRFATYKRFVIVVNSPNDPLIVDQTTVRRLSIRPPSSVVVLSEAAGGTLSGTFTVKQTFLVKNESGKIIAESDFGPESAALTISAKWLKVSNINLSRDSAVNASRLYRTATNGTEYFPWVDIDGNTQTTIQDDLSDVGLALGSTPEDLGTPPPLSLVASWRNRVWGVPKDRIDVVVFSGDGTPHGWAATNSLSIPPEGRDQTGVTALIPRRDELGVTRLDSVHKITGTSVDNFSRVQVVEGAGCISQESVVVIRDVGYFLGLDGVYSWGPDGVRSVSLEKVHAWFTTDTYFNRARFSSAFATYNALYDSYELHLAAVGSSVEDRWVSFEPATGRWLGPHKTGELTPTCAGQILDSNNLYIPAMGSSLGFIYLENRSGSVDGTATAIDYDVDTPFHKGTDPDRRQYWGMLSMLSKVESSGSLTVTPTVGWVNASAGTAITHTLTTGRERLQRLGQGNLCRLNFRQNTAAIPCTVFGYEVDEVHEVGRR